MIELGTCKNCKRPVFFDWRGTHHVSEEQAYAMSEYGRYDLRLNFSQPECIKAEEHEEED